MVAFWKMGVRVSEKTNNIKSRISMFGPEYTMKVKCSTQNLQIQILPCQYFALFISTLSFWTLLLLGALANNKLLFS